MHIPQVIVVTETYAHRMYVCHSRYIILLCHRTTEQSAGSSYMKSARGTTHAVDSRRIIIRVNRRVHTHTCTHAHTHTTAMTSSGDGTTAIETDTLSGARTRIDPRDPYTIRTRSVHDFRVYASLCRAPRKRSAYTGPMTVNNATKSA